MVTREQEHNDTPNLKLADPQEGPPEIDPNDPGPEEPPPEPQFTCGVTLLDNLNGEGFQIIPVQNGQEIRVATVDDILGLITKAQVHIQANLTMNKLMNELTKQRKMAAEVKAAADRRSQQRR